MNNETAKLINVLRRIARAASYASWVKADADAARFCAAQYNRVLARLNELEPNTRGLFAPLPEQSSPDVTRMAARDLTAYFEDDAPESHAWGFALGCSPRRFRARAECFPLAGRHRTFRSVTDNS
jgi:hypothetical protein